MMTVHAFMLMENLVIDDWRDHSEVANKANVELKAGKEYEIVIGIL